MEKIGYEIVKKDDVSYQDVPRMVYKVMLEVEEIPSKEQMKEVGIAIWKDGNKEWKEFTVFMYLPDMDTKNAAFAVVEFGLNGLKEVEVQDFALSGTKWEEVYDEFKK